MKRGWALLAAIAMSSCGGKAEVASGGNSAPVDNARAAELAYYSCFHVEVPANGTTAAGARGACFRTADDCQSVRATTLKSLAAERGSTEPPPASQCEPRDRAYCSFVEPTAEPVYNACAAELTTCSLIKSGLDGTGRAQTGTCLEFPSSRLDLPAVEAINFRLWCFRDATTVAGADCQPTQRTCEEKVNGLVRQGILQPQRWRDGSLCSAHGKVVCYPQLQRAQEQVKFICTPSFEECQARRAQAGGPDFEVLGECAVVTGNKPW